MMTSSNWSGTCFCCFLQQTGSNLPLLVNVVKECSLRTSLYGGHNLLPRLALTNLPEPDIKKRREIPKSKLIQ